MKARESVLNAKHLHNAKVWEIVHEDGRVIAVVESSEEIVKETHPDELSKKEVESSKGASAKQEVIATLSVDLDALASAFKHNVK